MQGEVIACSCQSQDSDIMNTKIIEDTSTHGSEATASDQCKTDSVKSSLCKVAVMKQKTFDNVCMVLAELIGTGILVFLGCMGCVPMNGIPSAISTVLNFGFTIMMIVQIFGHISFAILNPAVTVAAVVNKLITVKVIKIHKHNVKDINY